MGTSDGEEASIQNRPPRVEVIDTGEILHVTKAKYLQDYQIEMEFSSGDRRIVDLKDHLWGEIFEPVKDLEFFKQFKLNPDTGTIEWPNESDYAPEFFLTIGKPIN